MISTASSTAALACPPALAALPLSGSSTPTLTFSCAAAPATHAVEIATAPAIRQFFSPAFMFRSLARFRFVVSAIVQDVGLTRTRTLFVAS